jgi:hypothetical protein
VKGRRPGAVVLDNEAVGALADPAHPKHTDALAYLDVTNERRARGERVRVVVPVAVRIEAGWDRRAAAAANLNRICRAGDHPLDTTATDRATELGRLEPAASVVDVTVAQAAEAAGPEPVTIVTSDRDDFERLATHLHHPVVIALI